MLRVAEQWYKSDVGRQRQGNEDNFFVQAPLYVVADGMGGAQAGEVASEMAVEAFRGGLPNGSPEDGLVARIRQANKRIHDTSRSDSDRQGMGTTCTAAYVAEDEVVLAHVGDSRCYLFRGGELTRLTTDHSLVGELVDRGKLTEEQAEMQPQRSVITRALGPEADVRVDTERIEARSGDVFLLCSDGLTSMIREHQVLPIMRDAGSLEETGRNLIAAANAAGGRDNITVILFRVEDVDTSGIIGSTETQATAEGAAVDPAEDEYEDFTGTATAEPRQGITRAETQPLAGEGATAEVADEVRATDQQEQAYKEDFATTALPAIPRTPVRDPEPTPAPPPAPSASPPGATRSSAERPKTRRRFPLKGLLITLVIGAIVVFSAYIAIRAVFFVGVDDRQSVTIYRGLPYELPLGVDLYSTHYTSGVTLQQIPAGRREVFTEEKLRSLSDAEDLVEQAELGKLRE